jgi:hypothetical protein
MAYILKIIKEEDPISPREHNSNLFTMYCYHPRYNLGDFTDASDRYSTNNFVEVKSLLEEHYNPAIILPLSLYDHSGLAMQIGEFSDWDISMVGYIYISARDAKNYLNVSELEQVHLDELTRIAEEEVTEYSLYLQGEIYRMEVIETATCECCGVTREEVTDSIGGFYGDSPLSNGMVHYLNKPLSEYTILRDYK